MEAVDVDVEDISDVESEVDSDVESEVGSEVGSDVEGADLEGADLVEGADDDDDDDEGEGADISNIKETIDDDDDDDDEDDEDDDYLQKFSKNIHDDLIMNFHPESKSHNYEEVKQLAKVTRNKNGVIVDELHKTISILTKYEKTRILGQRAKQIETGAMPLVQVPPNVIDSYLIAKIELAQNKIPFIIRRPLPNGGMEYWYVSDLENL